LTGERSLQPAILPPKVSHVNGVVSVTFADEANTLEFTGLASSVVLDFFVKTIGAANLTEGKLKYFPLGVDKRFMPAIHARVLRLNCLAKWYAPLWERHFDERFKAEQWSRTDARLPPWQEMEAKWSWSAPLRSYYARRQSLVELDVIAAMALGLSFEELALIYEVQFPVLQKYESDTWYDATGNIVFTPNAQGLKAVGLDRADWEKIKDMKAGETYEHTITKSELYHGKKITYHAPFDKCDRVEDYKVAWAHFEKVFGKKSS
jgi:hypothetical protein